MKTKPEHDYKLKLRDHLYSCITAERKARFEDVACLRTRYISIVLENIFQSHNTSAVLRSCECFGIQDIHIIENENPFEVSPDVALGASKWLSLYSYPGEKDNTSTCLMHLKKKGYRIAAASPHFNDYTLDQIPIDKPIALVFGTELNGLSATAHELADVFVRIPMYGFTESFNISVSAAICLYSLTARLRASGFPWRLTENEKLDLEVQWLRSSINSAEMIEERFFKENQNQ